MYDLINILKTYFSFSINEAKSIVLVSIIMGFVFIFKEFTFINLIYAIIVAFISILFHITVQKILALKTGYNVEFKVWWYGIFLSLIFVFITNGVVWYILLPGGIIFSLIAKQRIGKFRYGLNYMPMGLIAFSGPLASVVFGTLFKEIFFMFPAAFINNIFIFNLVLAVNTMLPIPPLDGHYLFYASRAWYVILFSTIFVYSILVAFDIYSWVWAIIVGLIVWLFYYVKFESGYW